MLRCKSVCNWMDEDIEKLMCGIEGSAGDGAVFYVSDLTYKNGKTKWSFPFHVTVAFVALHPSS